MVAEASRVPCASCAARAPAADTERESGDQPGGERTWSARRKDTRARGSRARGSRPRRGLSRARQREQRGGEPGLAGGPLHVTGTRPPPALRRGRSVSKVAANTDLGDGERCSPGRPGLASCERPVALSPTDSYAAWPRGKTPSSALRVGSSTVNVQPTALWPRPGRTVSSTHVPTGHITASPVTHGPPSATRWVPRRCWRQRGDRRRAASAAPRGGRGRQAGSAHTLLKASQYVSSFV